MVRSPPPRSRILIDGAARRPCQSRFHAPEFAEWSPCRLPYPEMLRHIGSQQADAAATIQHGTDSLAIDQTGTRNCPLPAPRSPSWIAVRPGKIHGLASQGRAIAGSVHAAESNSTSYVAQHIRTHQPTISRYVRFCQPVVEVCAPKVARRHKRRRRWWSRRHLSVTCWSVDYGQQKKTSLRRRQHRALCAGVDRQPGV